MRARAGARARADGAKAMARIVSLFRCAFGTISNARARLCGDRSIRLTARRRRDATADGERSRGWMLGECVSVIQQLVS